MSTPEEPSFDRGFAHGYPRDRGLVERFQEETLRRTITEIIPETGDVFPSLVEADYPTFDYEEYSGVRIHFIPADARDLVELIRLGRDGQKIISLGTLLGQNMRDIIDSIHAFPADTVLSRFAGHNSNDPENSVGGGR